MGGALRRRQGRLLGALVVAAALVGGQVVAAPSAPAAGPRGELSGPLQALSDGGSRRVAPGDQRLRPSGAVDPSADGPGSLIETPDGVLVQVFSDELTSGLVDRLRSAGATVVDADAGYDIATVSAAPDELDDIAAVDGVRYVREVVEPLTSAPDRPRGATGLSVVQPSCGAAHTEGDAQLDAVGLRNDWDVEGAGVEVGILSDSWNRALNGVDATDASQDISSGDIPGPANPCPGLGRTTAVDVRAEGPSDGADEGRGMAQLVHDLAPAANLSFATAFTGDTAFANNIRDLRAAGADVIVDDVFYFNEPAFQNGPIGVAAEEVVADGAAYFSAIGNETVTIGGQPVSSYEAPAFRPVACPPTVPGQCHDFDSGGGTDNTFRVTVPLDGLLRMTLKWNEPWNGVGTNLDLYYLVNGVVIAKSIENNPTGSKQPYEGLAAVADGGAVNVDVVVSRPTGSTTPRFKLEHVRSNLTGSEYTTGTNGDVMGPNSGGHAAVPNGVGVGAVPYNSSTTPEPYSNRGPATWYWGPVIGSSAAAPLGAPQVLAKPDVAATDGGRTTFFYDQTPPFTTPRFYGTSAAAPHAAAVAALLLDCNPSLTPAQITATLEATANPVANGVPANVGAGLVDGRAAGMQVCLPPPAAPTFTVSDVTVAEGNGGFLATSKILAFTVSLTGPLTTAASVRYATADGTATTADYGAKPLTTLSFSAGQTSKVVNVTVKGDTVFEPNETMLLQLSSPVGAAISDAQGVGTITNDDPAPVVPGISVDDVTIVEGNPTLLGSTKSVTFTIRLSAPAPSGMSVIYNTADGTAVAPGDYTAKAPTVLRFSAGQTSKTVTVTLRMDSLAEPDEAFFLVLHDPVGATITDGLSVATIRNDD